MEKKGHKFLIISKDRNITFKLLDFYKIKYIKKRLSKSLIGKLISIPFTDIFIIIKSLVFKPDIMIGFAGTSRRFYIKYTFNCIR